VKYLLDTNICVYWLKGSEHIEQKVLSVGVDNIAISFVNVSELYYGATNRNGLTRILLSSNASPIALTSSNQMRPSARNSVA
jgi:predicted nucleic acid-binding protein